MTASKGGSEMIALSKAVDKRQRICATIGCLSYLLDSQYPLQLQSRACLSGNLGGPL